MEHADDFAAALGDRCPPCLHEGRRRMPVCSIIFNSGH
jgi:hypothetical protein